MVDRSGSATRAILLSLLALTLFDFMGLIIKHLSPYYSAAELSAYRNIFGLVPSILVLWWSRDWHSRGRPLAMRQWKLGLFRGVVVATAQLLFYFSLSQMAFATASTLSYSNAIFMTALAVPLLGERVGWVRWSAVLVGFCGVIWIMRPGSEVFSLAALAPVGAGFCYALSGVLSRLVDDDVPTPLINLYSAVCAVFAALALALALGGFSPLAKATDMLWIVAMGGFGGFAVLALIVSYRMTEQSNLAPFSYFGIPIAFFLGWVFFDEAPWADLFPGAILIIIGGLMVIWRERRRKRA
ncbi:MAG: DMT family transporter [Paracoccaceae bacterium]